ncbi:MAG: AraC family transcriptional regulator [Clostridia bacterium]|nr:AraC family transcriptional regulator [Clostridia bacterium]
MSGIIYKFERNMLFGETIHIKKKEDRTWFKMHWHNYYEIIYFRDCAGYCVLNGERFDLSERCLFLLTPKDFHEIVTEDRKNAVSFIISFSEQIVDKKILNALTAGPFVLHGVQNPLEQQIEELYEVFRGKDAYRERYLMHLFNCILINILENGKFIATIPRDINPIVRESISLMLLDPAKDFTLDFFAQKFKITKTYFSRLFHESIGVSFKRYLTDLRMEYAKRLLEEDELPIIDVGYECGFNTPSQFVRAFKKTVGKTPSEYRIQKRNSK